MAVGYAGYDVARYTENLPNSPADDRELPDFSFAFYYRMLDFDNVSKTMFVVALARSDKTKNTHTAAGEAYRQAQQTVVNANDNNKIRARVFSLGVGDDVNNRLLDKLARTCFGQSEYVRPNEGIEERVSKLYIRIGAPALTNIALKLDAEGNVTFELGGPSYELVD